MRKSDYDLDLGRTKEEKKNKNLRSSNRPFAEMEYYLVWRLIAINNFPYNE